METSDSDRIRAAGHPIVLRDGTEVRVRFGFLGLKMLEDSFGSLDDVMSAVKTDEKGNVTGKVIGPLVKILLAGLAEEAGFEDERTALPRLDTTRVNEYLTAVSRAMDEALPTPDPEANGQGKAAGPSASPGPTATTPPPSDLVAATPSFGT